MKDLTKKIILILIGIFLIAYGFLAMGFSIYRGTPDLIFWGCYIALLIIGIGAIKKSGYLIASQISIVAIYLIIWNIDFLYKLTTGTTLWGITDYFFTERLIIAQIITIQHLFILPLSLYAIYLTGLKSKDYWKVSFIETIVILLLTVWLTNPEYNVNCVFRSCFPLLEGIPLYFLSWMALSIIMIGINNWIINKMFYREN